MDVEGAPSYLDHRALGQAIMLYVFATYEDSWIATTLQG